MIGPPITANSANITTNDHLISDFFIESPPIILVKIAVGKMPCLSAGHSSLSKKSGWSWAFSDRYGRMDKGDARCWNAGKWIEIW